MIDHPMTLLLMPMLVTPIIIERETKNKRSPGPEVEEEKNWHIQSDHNTGTGVSSRL